MKNRGGKFLSFYRPYLGLLAVDLFCAFVISAITLVLPLCVRFITGTLLQGGSAQALDDLAIMGGIMLALVAVHALCNFFRGLSGAYDGRHDGKRYAPRVVRALSEAVFQLL